jgi:uncharacterized protein (DUF1501 family)
MSNSRRDFLKKSVGLVSLSATAPLWLRSAIANAQGTITAKTLVVVQLDGGNDGINTVIPYTLGAYRDARPTLAIPSSSVLPLDGSVGLHPSLTGFKSLFDAQKLAVVQGVGYPVPNRSHFRSREIWQTADPVEIDATGWLGRYADAYLADAGELAAIAIGGALPKALYANTVVVPSIASLDLYKFNTDVAYPGDAHNQVTTYLGVNDRPTATGDELALAETATGAYSGSTTLQTASGGYVPKATYPTSKLAADLQFAAQIITAGVGTRVLYVTTGGYDTHANQPNDQGRLLKDLGDALLAFQTDLEGQGIADRVATLVWSEFGRRVEENGSDGTDHGTASVSFVVGTAVAGGLFGEYPSLTSLDANGDLIFTVDFRSVYADMVETWLGVPSHDILEGDFAKIGVFR